MVGLQTKAPLDWYLQSTQLIDVEHEIKLLISSYNHNRKDEIDIVRDIFEFVRDEIEGQIPVEFKRLNNIKEDADK